MPARFVITSLVTKRAGIAARFVTLVTKRAVVTKRAAREDQTRTNQLYVSTQNVFVRSKITDFNEEDR